MWIGLSAADLDLGQLPLAHLLRPEQTRRLPSAVTIGDPHQYSPLSVCSVHQHGLPATCLPTDSADVKSVRFDGRDPGSLMGQVPNTIARRSRHPLINIPRQTAAGAAALGIGTRLRDFVSCPRASTSSAPFRPLAVFVATLHNERCRVLIPGGRRRCKHA